MTTTYVVTGANGGLGEVVTRHLAATGGRVVAQAAKLIKENGGGRALVSICAAGGQGVTAIIEG